MNLLTLFLVTIGVILVGLGFTIILSCKIVDRAFNKVKEDEKYEL